MNDTWIRLALLFFCASTALSGLAQLIAPEWALRTMGAEVTSTTVQLFRTIGMFALVTGAMFLHALLRLSKEPAIPLWIGVEKFIATALMAWGIATGVFSAFAWVPASFGLVSGILAWIFLARLNK
ncbi:MAG: hypothetical protein QOD42_2184 [Sphingomonadales bacterium]|jgi:uncharacterized protein YjeT (DUF2065 family)|nr:hypothetical protein [Sphingomonadales bacterium]